MLGSNVRIDATRHAFQVLSCTVGKPMRFNDAPMLVSDRRLAMLRMTASDHADSEPPPHCLAEQLPRLFANGFGKTCSRIFPV